MPYCSSSSSDTAHAEKYHRVATVEQQQLEHPEFIIVLLERELFCKICVSFSGISSPGVLYIAKVNTKTNKVLYNTLVRKCTNVWKMLREASLTPEINKTNPN